MRIKTPAGMTLTVELDYKKSCSDANAVPVKVSSSSLGWKFDGTEKLYSFKWSQFPGLDSSKITTLLITGFSKAIAFRSISFYCGNAPSDYTIAASATRSSSSSTVATPTGSAAALVIDQFVSKDSNALGFWHGIDEGMTATWGSKSLKLVSTDADYSFYTLLSASCRVSQPFMLSV
jgi:hypothetical protein